ncbi:MAG: hypothetical protein WC677_06065 [Clostridia bacterium]|jgi:hypothetical protein
MYNKIIRDSQYIYELKIFLENNYDIQIESIDEAKRGFFGETWKIATTKGKYFAKIDYSIPHKHIYINSFDIIEHLNNNGIKHICKILKTKENTLYTIFRSGVMGIFDYVEGENTENYEISRLFEKLAPIYKISAPNIKIKKEDFSVGCIDSYYENLKNLKQNATGLILKEVVSYLGNNDEIVKHKANRLTMFADRCRSDKSNYYITHGDAGGNSIINGDNFTIIDWDFPMLSPIERDAWFFMTNNQNIKMINDILLANEIRYKLNNDRLAYYCYHSFFYYMYEYLSCYFEIEDNVSEDIAKGILGFFDCWIKKPIEIADGYS